MTAILALCILVPIAFAMGVRLGRWHELDRRCEPTLQRCVREEREESHRFARAVAPSLRTPKPGAWRRLA